MAVGLPIVALYLPNVAVQVPISEVHLPMVYNFISKKFPTGKIHYR